VDSKRYFTKRFFIAKVIILLVYLCYTESVSADAPPRYVFYFIGGGLGAAQRQIAEYFYQDLDRKNATKKLFMNSLKYAALINTASANSRIPDDAASASALATGNKTNNGRISTLPGGGVYARTILESASYNGFGTGLITAAKLTEPAAAAFVSHNNDKTRQDDLAVQIASSSIDFFAGGGYSHFASRQGEYIVGRSDGQNLVAKMGGRGYYTFIGADSSNKFRSVQNPKVFAAFTPGHLPFEIDRQKLQYPENIPSIKEMLEKAIQVLSVRERFLIVINGGLIDKALEKHDIVSALNEIVAFDKAVEVAYNFLKQHPYTTLLIVTGDREVGGLAVNSDSLNFAAVKNCTISIVDGIPTLIEDPFTSFDVIINKYLGLDNLNSKDLNDLRKLYDRKDVAGFNNIVTDIFANKVGVTFASNGSTAEQIPVSIEGQFDYTFQGYMDNIDLPRFMARAMSINLY
jgi:alkaline phosphatase